MPNLNPKYVLDSIPSMTKTGAWTRLGTTVVLSITAIWGLIVWRINYNSIRINLSSDIYMTLYPILYAISLVAAVYGFASALSSLRSAGDRKGWVPTILLTMLVVLCLWTAVSGFLSRAYAV